MWLFYEHLAIPLGKPKYGTVSEIFTLSRWSVNLVSKAEKKNMVFVSLWDLVISSPVYASFDEFRSGTKALPTEPENVEYNAGPVFDCTEFEVRLGGGFRGAKPP